MFVNTYVCKHEGKNEDLVKDANKIWRDRKDANCPVEEQEDLLKKN